MTLSCRHSFIRQEMMMDGASKNGTAVDMDRQRFRVFQIFT